MFTRTIAIVFGVAAVAVLNALISQPPNGEVLEARLTDPVEASSPINTGIICERPKYQIQAGDVIDTFDQLTHGDYAIQMRYRMAKLETPLESGPPPKPVRVSYLVVRRKGKVVAKFDAIYSLFGNHTGAGFVSLLGPGKDQLIISQDLPKTGVQWVADLSKGFKVVFDGLKFEVGREGDDMTISDLDGDGIQEIIVPITAFYGFQSQRLTTAETPLPDIIFRYDPVQREYLPANLFFKKCILKDTETAEKSAREIEKEISLGRLMPTVLDYVFVGEEERGWKFFEEMCTLPDKARIRSDMQAVLNGHPVYRHIYKTRANR